MYGHGKSDRPIVPEKPSNKGCGAPRSAKGVEERGLAKGNSAQQNRDRAQNRETLQSALDQIWQIGCLKGKNSACASDPR